MVYGQSRDTIVDAVQRKELALWKKYSAMERGTALRNRWYTAHTRLQAWLWVH